MCLESEFRKLLEESGGKVQWKKVAKEGLDLDYAVLLGKRLADELFTQLEEMVEYYSGELTKASVSFHKHHRKKGLMHLN